MLGFKKSMSRSKLGEVGFRENHFSESSSQFTPLNSEISSFLTKSLLKVPRRNLIPLREKSFSHAAKV